MDSKKSIIYFAYFIRYGYFALIVLVLWAIKKLNVTSDIFGYTLFGMATLYGIYFLVGLQFKFKHLYCAMQSAYRQRMTPYYSCDFTYKMERDIRFIGCFFIIIGIIGIIVIYIGI